MKQSYLLACLSSLLLAFVCVIPASGSLVPALRAPGGVSDFGTVANSATVRMDNTMTLEAWLYPTSWRSYTGREKHGLNFIYKGRIGSYIEYVFALQENGILCLGNTWGCIGVLNRRVPLNQWTHVAVTLDGRQGVLYLNGKPVGVNNSVNLMPADLGLVNCWLGRSQSSADPFFRGQLDSVVLSSAALWPEQTLVAPPLDAVVADQALRLSWPPWGAGFALWSVSEITGTAPWSPVVQEPEVADGLWTLSMPVAGSKRFYRLQWPWPTP